MITQLIPRWRFPRIGFLALTLLSFTILVGTSACTGRGDSVKKTEPTEDDGGGLLGDEGISTDSSGNTNSTMFDTDLNGDEAQSGSQSGNSFPSGTPTSGQQACYTGNPFYDDQYYGVRGVESGLSDACISPNQSGARYPLSEDYFYSAALDNYGGIEDCGELASSFVSRYATDQNAHEVIQRGLMGLARCHRDQNHETETYLPWGNEALGLFQNHDTYLRTFIIISNQM